METGKDNQIEGRPIGEFAPLTLEQATHVKVYIDIGMIGIVDINSVNPYDKHHFPWGDSRWKKLIKEHPGVENSEESHKKGVERVKECLKENKVIRPILVFNGFRRQDMEDYKDVVDWSKVRYQRLDGFKRYMAFKELGIKWIVVHVVNTWIEGGQGDQPFFL
jgi:hypothetical protein